MSTTPDTESRTSPEGPGRPGPETAKDQGDGGLDRGLLMVAGVAVLGALMSILDVTVVNVAIPALVQEFDSTLSTIQWVATGYTLALATVIPVSGWGAERFGTKRLYMISVGLFVAGSVLAGLAWSAESLIAFRVLQGFGGGMIMPLVMMILTRAAGPQRVGRVMAVMGVPMLLGPIFGPILGGWLVEDFSWRWIFFINLPIGVLTILLAARILPSDVPQPHHRLDWLGLALLSPSLAAIIYGLAQSSADPSTGETGGFGSSDVLIPLIAGLVAFGLFLVHATRSKNPLVDLRLYRNRVYSTASGTLMLMIISVFGGMLLMPVYFAQVRAESAMAIGLLLAPQGLGAMLAMPIAGRLSDTTGVGRIVPFGLTAIGASFVLLTQLQSDTSYWLIGGILFLQGLGMGFSMMPLFSGAMQTLRRADISNASTTLNITQQVGASIGTAVLSVILTNEIAERIPPAPAGATEGGPVPPEVLAQLSRLTAEAFGSTFWWAVGLVVVAFVAATVLLPKHKPEPLEDDADETVPVLMG